MSFGLDIMIEDFRPPKFLRYLFWYLKFCPQPFFNMNTKITVFLICDCLDVNLIYKYKVIKYTMETKNIYCFFCILEERWLPKCKMDTRSNNIMYFNQFHGYQCTCFSQKYPLEIFVQKPRVNITSYIIGNIWYNGVSQKCK